MNKEKRFSDEFLNSFVDNQLAPGEKSRAYVEISADPELNRQVCEIRKMHDLVQFAYQDVPAPPRNADGSQTPRRRWASAAAAAAILVAGVAVGLKLEMQQTTAIATAKQESARIVVSHRSGKTPGKTQPRQAATHVAPPTAAAAVRPAPTVRNAVMSTLLDDDTVSPRSINDVQIGNVRNKVLIHIAHDDQQRLAQALEEIEGLMRYYRDTHQSAHVEVVINGRGMELVRVDKSAHAAEIARLQKEYDNLTFAACQNTIDRLRREDGIVVRLLPGVVITDSGMAEIMRRQHQGWTYLRV